MSHGPQIMLLRKKRGLPCLGLHEIRNSLDTFLFPSLTVRTWSQNIQSLIQNPEVIVLLNNYFPQPGLKFSKEISLEWLRLFHLFLFSLLPGTSIPYPTPNLPLLDSMFSPLPLAVSRFSAVAPPDSQSGLEVFSGPLASLK